MLGLTRGKDQFQLYQLKRSSEYGAVVDPFCCETSVHSQRRIAAKREPKLFNFSQLWSARSVRVLEIDPLFSIDMIGAIILRHCVGNIVYRVPGIIHFDRRLCLSRWDERLNETTKSQTRQIP